MINIGDLVEWAEINKGEGYEVCFQRIGFVFKTKIQSLDGVNEEKMFKVHFPNRQQYWIPTNKLSKVA